MLFYTTYSHYIEFGSSYTINNLRNFDTYVMKLISFGCNQYDRGCSFSLPLKNLLDRIKEENVNAYEKILNS